MMPPEEEPPMERRGSRLSRRAFALGAAGLGLLAGCGRAPWQPAPPAKVPRIGMLGGASEVEAQATFTHSLQDLGYVEGQNLLVERRFADEQGDRLPTLVAELVSLRVDLIVAA